MVKFSQTPNEPSPAVTHYLEGYNSGPTTVRYLITDLITLFFNNIPSGAFNPVTRQMETMFNFVASGGVWSGDSYGSTRNASMTAATVYINGRRILISAVVSRAFTASKDTYVDILDNGDNTGTLVYTEVTNNAASPSLAANSMRIGIIVTGASNIAAVGSINQGQETKILPIASSIPYQVTDSLGNLICNRNPESNILGWRRRLSTFSTSSGSFVDITEITIPFILGAERKVEFSLDASAININGTGFIWTLALVLDGTVIQQWYRNQDVAGYNIPVAIDFDKTVAAGSHTAKFQLAVGAGTATITGGADNPGTSPTTAGPISGKVELK